MTIRTKLILSFAAMLLLTAILGLTTLWETQRLSSSQDLIVNDRMPKLAAVNVIKSLNPRIQQNFREYLLVSDDADRKVLMERISQYRQTVAQQFEYLKQTIKSEKGKQLLANLEAKNTDMVEVNNLAVEWVKNGYEEQAKQTILDSTAREKRIALREALQAIADYQDALAAESGDEGVQIANETRIVVTAILVAGLIFGVLMVIYILRSAVKPIKEMQNVMQAVAQDGNFKRQVPVNNEDEIGLALVAFNQLLKNLDEAIEQTGVVVMALSQGDFSKRITGEFVGSLNDVKQGVNTSVEQVSSTMAELNQLMQAMAGGDFKAGFDADVKGEFAEIASSAMATVKGLDRVISEINGVMAQVVDGQFSGRVKADAEGDLAKLKTSINETLNNLESVMRNIGEVLQAQAQGDFTKEITTECHGQLKELKDAIHFSSTKVSEVIAQISHSNEVVASAANELAQGSSDLSSRVQQQAAALEETSATMDQMASTVKQNTDNAIQVADMSQQASEEAGQGMTVMKQTIEAMNGIKDSSHRIADIVTLIDGIAFQTNLLALNAAVEAARAGDHGRGFAVVAGEVRALAQKSAEAAKEIKDLIEESVSRVENGSRLAEDSGQSLESITEVIRQVNGMINEISKASQEQTTGVEQVNRVVTDIDQMTQQNAALVEESASASEELNEQANEMREAVAFFKVVGGYTPKALEAETALNAPKASNPAALEIKPANNTEKPALTKPASNSEKALENEGEWSTF